MKLAIVVSGALRFMKQASTSWKIDGDYLLVVDKNYYDSQGCYPEGIIYNLLAEELKSTDINFQSTLIDVMPASDFDATNNALKMSWKWKLAYNMLLIRHKKTPYSGVLLLRPDIYIQSESYKLPTIEKNTIYTNQIPFIHSNGYPWVSDCFLYMDMQTFEILSKFYDYLYLSYRDNEIIDTGVHYYLYQYVIDNGIKFDNGLKEFHYTILRETAIDLFNEKGLKEEYKYFDLTTKAAEWWEKKFGK